MSRICNTPIQPHGLPYEVAFSFRQAFPELYAEMRCSKLLTGDEVNRAFYLTVIRYKSPRLKMLPVQRDAVTKDLWQDFINKELSLPGTSILAQARSNGNTLLSLLSAAYVLKDDVIKQI